MSDLSLLFFYTTKLDSKMIWNEFLNKKINFLTVLKIHRVYIAQLITRYAGDLDKLKELNENDKSNFLNNFLI